MRTGLIEFGIFFASGFLVALLLFKCGSKETETIETVTTIERVDTVFINNYPVPIRVTPRTLIDTLKVYDSVRVYTGSYQFQHGKLDYSIRTLGYLDTYTFSPTIFVPTTTTTRTIMVEKPKLYAVGSYGLTGPSLGAVYARKNALYGYSYNPIINEHRFSLGVRLH